MKKIVVIGAGGFAREVKFLIKEINKAQREYDFLGFLVSDLKNLKDTDSKEEVIGDLSWFEKVHETIYAAIGVGTPKNRLKIGNDISNQFVNVIFPTLIHPNVIYDRGSCEFERGVIICSYNVLTVNVLIKEFSLVNLSCTIGHEAIIGAGCVINPTVNVSGGVELGNGVLVGTGAQILQYVQIGDNAIIGAGACVTKDVDSGVTVVGVPAKTLK